MTLKPCPFCGEPPKVSVRLGDCVYTCKNPLCGCMFVLYAKTEEEAIENWNRRVESDSRIAKLEVITIKQHAALREIIELCKCAPGDVTSIAYTARKGLE